MSQRDYESFRIETLNRGSNSKMRIGAHISSSGGLKKVVGRAKSWGAEVAQIFISSPQMWKSASVPKEELLEFKALADKADLELFIHSIYLINLGSNNPFFQKASVESLINAITTGGVFGAKGVITHIGSHKEEKFKEVLPRVKANIKKVLAETDGAAPELLLENAAGAGNIIGDTLEEIATILNEVGSDRVKVAIDTAHAFASGYEIKTKTGLFDFLAAFEKLIGLKKLKAFHFNDTNISLGGRRDKHEPIGKGILGVETFKNILCTSSLSKIPVIIETPDLDPKKERVESLEILKKIRDKEQLPDSF